MPRTTTTTVQEDEHGYFATRIPKALGDGLQLEGGDKIEWRIESGNSLRIVKQ